MSSRKNSSHAGAWLKFFLVVFLLAVAGLVAAYYFGWGWFRPAYRTRAMTALAGDYYEAYRAQIIEQSGLDAAVSHLAGRTESSGGIYLPLGDLLRGKNGELQNVYGRRLIGCNPSATVARIIPEEPYGAKDFKLEMTLRCSD